MTKRQIYSFCAVLFSLFLITSLFPARNVFSTGSSTTFGPSDIIRRNADDTPSNISLATEASYIIDVSGSTYRMWNATNIIDSSTNASAVINNAIGNGTDVYLTEGTYAISSSTIQISNPSVRLHSNGKAILSCSGAPPAFPYACIYTTANHVTVENLIIQASSSNYYGVFVGGNYSTVRNNEISGSQLAGIQIESPAATVNNNVHIEDNYVHDIWDATTNYGSGIRCTYFGGSTGGVNNIWIERNTVYNVSEHGIKVYSPCNYSIITNNHVEMCNSSAIEALGWDNLIQGNICYNSSYGNAYWAISVGENGKILDNTINWTVSANGISIYSNGTTISRNVIENIGGANGIGLSSNVNATLISENHLIDCATWGIGESGCFNKIMYNDFCRCNYGCLQINGNYTLVQGNTFREGARAASWTSPACYTLFFDNILSGTSFYSFDGTSVTWRDNVGFVTENSGSWSGTNPVTVAHGCAGTPTIVNIGVNAAQPYSTSWTADATNIVIYHNGAGSLSGSWEAQYVP